MRVLSLLPTTTELVCASGAGTNWSTRLVWLIEGIGAGEFAGRRRPREGGL
jgi:hypothetical protein